VDPPVAAELAQGIVWIQYRVENVRILPVFGAGALNERRPHIGGAVGAALAKRCFELKWIERARDSRALTITPAGHVGLMEQFTLSI
jgi:hypothetical protein